MRRTTVRQEDLAVPVRLRRKYRLVLNEPVLQRAGDLVPALGRVRLTNLGSVVDARLRLERDLRACGLAKPGPSPMVTTAARKALLAMLDEADSPLSASLRMRAAVMLGPAGVKAAAPRLRRIALDESDDLSTRLGAVRSYLCLSGNRGAAALRQLARSAHWQVRACAFVESMGGKATALQAVARKLFATERNDKVKAYVGRRVTSIQSESSTDGDGS